MVYSIIFLFSDIFTTFSKTSTVRTIKYGTKKKIQYPGTTKVQKMTIDFQKILNFSHSRFTLFPFRKFYETKIKILPQYHKYFCYQPNHYFQQLYDQISDVLERNYWDYILDSSLNKRQANLFPFTLLIASIPH